MSEQKSGKSIVEDLNAELAKYRAQKESFQVNLQQCIGAIYATELAIKKLEDKEKADAESLSKLEDEIKLELV